MTYLTTDQFGYDKLTGIFSQEASTLGQPAGKELDAVLALTNPKTNRTCLFLFSNDLTEGNEVVGWEFKPVKAIPGVEKMVIFND